ncbi:uncharacterized protein LOC106473181 [Limulus polyphemus]|uniref:Uncharacterized protein LOC106473181 n=1 Tax=Limulus polyphemus TaxID=6850 RepID=A0ABM1BV80_LIMPO|nr:uncharacterized protein LOC106473181 [Limulus polyphemus]XP_013789316.1 uncharacterized protein LOC106473181 [Limulus polyphemus]
MKKLILQLVFAVLFYKVECLQWNILVFGGNGFIGSECVNVLKKEHKVTLVNRGTLYWDTEKRILPYITQISCDRNVGLENCAKFMQYLEQTSNIDFVIDFSGYHPDIIQNACKVLQGKVGTYIYISSDSVYEVIIKNHTTPSKETDAERPSSIKEQERLNSLDPYGHSKLAGEEILRKQRDEGGFPFIFLRLPDVIGPRDTTKRWWTYQLWLQLVNSTGRPILIPEKVMSITSSLVFVKDVAKIMPKVFELAAEKDAAVLDHSFNLAFSEHFTVRMILDKMQDILGLRGVEYQYVKSEDTFEIYSSVFSFHIFPSVFQGPVDISSAEKVLDWSPTPWNIAAVDTINFYVQAFHCFPEERDVIVHRLLTHVVSPSHRDIFLEAVENMTKKGLPDGFSCAYDLIGTFHDEL